MMTFTGRVALWATIIQFSTLTLASGQEITLGFQRGIIHQKDGTEIFGFVESNTALGSTVRYKLNLYDEERIVNATEIEFIRTPFRYFESVLVGDKTLLMALMSGGKVRLFISAETGLGTPEQVRGGTYTPLTEPDIRYAIVKHGITRELTHRNFKQVLGAVLSDQPSILDRLDKLKLRMPDINDLLNEYNELERKQGYSPQILVRIMDEATLKPVSGSKVMTLESTGEAQSNSLGFVQLFTDSCKRIVVDHPDYELAMVEMPNAGNFQIRVRRSPSTTPVNRGETIDSKSDHVWSKVHGVE